MMFSLEGNNKVVTLGVSEKSIFENFDNQPAETCKTRDILANTVKIKVFEWLDVLTRSTYGPKQHFLSAEHSPAAPFLFNPGFETVQSQILRPSRKTRGRIVV